MDERWVRVRGVVFRRRGNAGVGMLLNPCFSQCFLADDRLCQRDDLQEAETGGSSCGIRAD